MNAVDARKRLKGQPSLVDRVRRDPARAARIDAAVEHASIEMMIRDIMARKHVTPSELARRIKVTRPQVSRDLKGGLSKATVSRVRRLAEALGYDFYPVFVERGESAKRTAALDAIKGLMIPDELSGLLD